MSIRSHSNGRPISTSSGPTSWPRSNEIPLNPSMEHIPMRSTDEVDVYEIHYDSLDHVRVAGLVRPADGVATSRRLTQAC